MADIDKPIDPAEYKKITEEMYKQNLELARLYKQVDGLNKQRESLMHLINHKVKGAFTRSKYIFAGILDGTFGEINAEIKKRAEQGLESDNTGIETIDLVLNAANMEKGTVKYELKPLDFKEIALKVVSEKSERAANRGLKIESGIENKEPQMVNGDAFWLKEVVNNLVENSIRYSKEGKITVTLTKSGDKIILAVKDTGIGITEEDKKNLFTEGGRGKDSVKINVDSTGYGLYSVKLIVEAHKGRVWAESAGPGLGSTFFVELPAYR
jgi:signal transduction histidine kinase